MPYSLLNKIKAAGKNLLMLPNFVVKLENNLAVQKILAAKSLINSFDYSGDLPLSNYEFSVFSQWGDDGIIQYLINTIDIQEKYFIEFGVENYTEANTRFLLINNNWGGLVMDGSKPNMDELRNSELYWKFDLKVKDVFITRENINGLIQEQGLARDIGILSIDIDGNDYWVWEAITAIEPVIVIVEYNSVLGIEHPWTVPYQPDFYRTAAHFSNLYYGASLLSLCDLAEKKGYYFTGCNSAGNNAYFVRKDKIGPIKPLSPLEGYVCSVFKESRNEQGYLSYLAGAERLQLLKGMSIYNTRTTQTETIR
ncbi:hypothetical protein [Mucilaginibacter flavidus]|uniref:hypothetical protein n=1 Tax=Mucilaginibacter flavidus TaxID=2949309 RepID=UPI002093E65A|nr:hypothetical protein [Mucilaginibacter flavidus]MCO5947668.1 hypothetical protein [Mucilaginibacter flavidus]